MGGGTAEKTEGGWYQATVSPAYLYASSDLSQSNVVPLKFNPKVSSMSIGLGNDFAPNRRQAIT